MNALEYVEAVRKAQLEDDYVKVRELEEEFGKVTVTYQDLEEVYSNQFSVLAGFALSLERKEQTHYDVLVGLLAESGVFNEEQVEKIIKLEEELNEALEGE